MGVPKKHKFERKDHSQLLNQRLSLRNKDQSHRTYYRTIRRVPLPNHSWIASQVNMDSGTPLFKWIHSRKCSMEHPLKKMFYLRLRSYQCLGRPIQLKWQSNSYEQKTRRYIRNLFRVSFKNTWQKSDLPKGSIRIYWLMTRPREPHLL